MATRDILTFRTSKGSALSFNEMDGNFTKLADTIDQLTVSTAFNDLFVTGNLTVTGVLTSINSTQMEIGDPIIVLNKNSITPSNDVGLILQRYSVASPTNYNIGFVWDESTDKLIIGKTSETATDVDVTFDTNWLVIDSAGKVGVGNVSPASKLDVSGDLRINTSINLDAEALTLATLTKTQIASFTAASFRSGKLIVQVYDSVTGEVQISELLVVHNGTTASSTEYGVVYTGSASLVTFDVDILSGNVRLLATRTTTNSTQYKVSETLIVA